MKRQDGFPFYRDTISNPRCQHRSVAKGDGILKRSHKPQGSVPPVTCQKSEYGRRLFGHWTFLFLFKPQDQPFHLPVFHRPHMTCYALHSACVPRALGTRGEEHRSAHAWGTEEAKVCSSPRPSPDSGPYTSAEVAGAEREPLRFSKLPSKLPG